MISKNGLIAALDIGSTKVCAAIARVESDQRLRLLGLGQQISKGLKYGTIVDMEALEVSILNAVHSAEEMASETIQNVVLSCSSPILSQIGDVEMPIQGREIVEEDLKHLFMCAQENLRVHQARGGHPHELIHAFPIGYTVDGNRGIRDPRGMFCEKLGVSLHVVNFPTPVFRNLVQCVARCHLSLSQVVTSSYASSLSTLVEDEMDLGVTLVEIGGGVTSWATFLDGHCVSLGMIPLGGGHITSDIAQGLSTPIVQAERLKTLYGSALPTASDEKETILVPQIGENQNTHAIQITKGSLNHIIKPRLEEIFEYLKDKLDGTGPFKGATRRIVLTGGASQMFGLKELASNVLGRQIRLGKPLHIRGLSETSSNPSFSTVLGLLNFSSGRYKQNLFLNLEQPTFKTRFTSLFKKR